MLPGIVDNVQQCVPTASDSRVAAGWQIPIGAVQALVSAGVVSGNPIMNFLLHAPVLDSIITAILPSTPLVLPAPNRLGLG